MRRLREADETDQLVWLALGVFAVLIVVGAVRSWPLWAAVAIPLASIAAARGTMRWIHQPPGRFRRFCFAYYRVAARYRTSQLWWLAYMAVLSFSVWALAPESWPDWAATVVVWVSAAVAAGGHMLVYHLGCNEYIRGLRAYSRDQIRSGKLAG